MAFDPTPPPYILGNGVTNITGLTEPLQSIAQKIRNFGGEVKVSITGDRKLDYVDFANAWLKIMIFHHNLYQKHLATEMKII